MFSSDKNIETITALIEELKTQIGLRSEMLKLDVIDKTVRVITALSVALVVFMLVLVMFMYLSFAAAYALGDAINSVSLAFLIVAACYLLLVCLIISKRQAWIERPFVRLLSSIIFK